MSERQRVRVEVDMYRIAPYGYHDLDRVIQDLTNLKNDGCNQVTINAMTDSNNNPNCIRIVGFETRLENDQEYNQRIKMEELERLMIIDEERSRKEEEIQKLQNEIDELNREANITKLKNKL